MKVKTRLKLIEVVRAWARDARLVMDKEPVTDKAELLLMQATQIELLMS